MYLKLSVLCPENQNEAVELENNFGANIQNT